MAKNPVREFILDKTGANKIIKGLRNEPEKKPAKLPPKPALREGPRVSAMPRMTANGKHVRAGGERKGASDFYRD